MVIGMEMTYGLVRTGWGTGLKGDVNDGVLANGWCARILRTAAKCRCADDLIK